MRSPSIKQSARRTGRLIVVCLLAILVGCEGTVPEQAPPLPLPSQSLPEVIAPPDADPQPPTEPSDGAQSPDSPKSDTVPTTPNLPGIPDGPPVYDTPGADQDPQATAVNIMSVEPPIASPGTTVRIKTDQPIFPTDLEPSFLDELAIVEIGGKAALLLAVGDPTEATVLVPLIEPGQAGVLVNAPDVTTKTPGQLDVLDAPTLQLVLRIGKESAVLLGAYPRTGGHTESAPEPDEPRIAYDVIDHKGNLVATGTVVHPIYGRREHYVDSPDGEIVLARTLVFEDAVVAVKVPNTPGGVVRLYEAASGIDLGTPEGRAARTFITEINLNS